MDIDWKFWAPMIATLVQLFIAIIWFRLQIKQWSMAMAPAKVQEANRMSRFGKYWPILAMLAAMIGSWAPYVLQKPDLNKAILGYGVVGQPGAPWPSFPNPPEVYVLVDGRKLLSYKDNHISKNYHIAGVAFHFAGTTDESDVKDMQKSTLYDIRDADVQVVISLNHDFMKEFQLGARMTFYRALLIPDGVRMEDFDSLRQAYKLGVILIGAGAGPP